MVGNPGPFAVEQVSKSGQSRCRGRNLHVIMVRALDGKELLRFIRSAKQLVAMPGSNH